MHQLVSIIASKANAHDDDTYTFDLFSCRTQAFLRVITDSQMRQFVPFGLEEAFRSTGQGAVSMDTGLVIDLRMRKSLAEQALLRCANYATKQGM